MRALEKYFLNKIILQSLTLIPTMKIFLSQMTKITFIVTVAKTIL